jgi:GAF domain-containing protein
VNELHSDKLPPGEEHLLVDWPLSPEAARTQLQQARVALDRYRAALRLARKEIEQRNKTIRALTAFTYQAGRANNLPALWELTLSRALKTTETEVGAVVLLVSETKSLSLVAHRGLTPVLTRILTGRQFDAGAAVLMPHVVAGQGALFEYQPDIDADERLLLTAGQLNSLVSLPLQVGDQLLGALLVGTQGKTTFSPADLYFLIALSQEAAVAMQSMEIRERLWYLAETFLDDKNIPAASSIPPTIALDMSPVASSASPLQTKLAEIVRHSGGVMGALFLLENSKSGMQATLVTDYGLSPAFTGMFAHFSLSENLLPFELLAQRKLILGDITQLSSSQASPLLNNLQDEGALSLVAGQLPTTDKKLWIILAAATEPDALTITNLKKLVLAGKDLPLLQGESDPTPPPPPKIPAASLVPQADHEDLEKLLAAMMDAEEEVQQHNADLAMLNNISEMITSTFNLDRILNQVITQTRTMLHTDAAWLYLVDETATNVAQKRLVLQIHEGLSERYIRGMSHITFGKPLEGLVAQTNEAHFVDDVVNYTVRCHLLVEQEGLHAIAVVPLSCPDEDKGRESRQILGVLGIGRSEVHAWRPREIRLLTSIANQVGLAINNAQLYNQVKEGMTMLANSNKILQNVNSQLLAEQTALQEELTALKQKLNKM